MKNILNYMILKDFITICRMEWKTNFEIPKFTLRFSKSKSWKWKWDINGSFHPIFTFNHFLACIIFFFAFFGWKNLTRILYYLIMILKLPGTAHYNWEAFISYLGIEDIQLYVSWINTVWLVDTGWLCFCVTMTAYIKIHIVSKKIE